ncbi:MAG: hypothetical protein M1514_02620 [Patescibacteria group bacterium]|nr:hypothetical protein [Patescibacteria group bacterium]
MQNLGKKVKYFFLIFGAICFFSLCGQVVAAENLFVTIVNPIRGNEFIKEPQGDPLFGVKLEKDLIAKFKLPVTWLLRYDALRSSSFNEYFQNLSSKEEVGLFLEITPSLAEVAGVNYPGGGIFWHDANKIFLSGYQPEQRLKLIDTVFWEYRKVFGSFPKSVGAWHVDAYSAEYMRTKYGISGVLICADQFGTDRYQIWGGWWGVPFYPSKYNILTPAQTLKNKIDAVVFWWAARDPVLGYGPKVEDSTYSVQANDYSIHHLKDISYFNGLLNLYLDKSNSFGQLTIGLESDNDWEKVGDSFEEQLALISEKFAKNELKVATMAEFSQWYQNRFSQLSPDHHIGPWLMTRDFRAYVVKDNNQEVVKDLRLYNEKWPEADLLTANPWESLALNNPAKIDTIRFPDSEKKFPGLNLKDLVKTFGSQKIPFVVNDLLIFIFYGLLIAALTICLRKNLPLLFLILVGSLSLSLTMVKSGWVYSYGMGFWGPNGHDGIWHLALINQLSKFSFSHPSFSSFPLLNYHFGFDILAAILRIISGVSAVNLYFQVLPPVMSVLLGILTYKLVSRWTNKTGAWWATFFVYFGGSWAWLLGKGESTFWANQAISTLINPPFALSLIFLLIGFFRLENYLEKKDGRNLLLTAFIFGILIFIKVYAGVIVLGSLLIVFLFSLIVRRNQVILGKLFFFSLIVALAVFLPFNSQSSSLLVISPLWFSHTMLAFADRLGWLRLENARQAYFNSGNWLKWFLAESLALLIFIFGNLGIRFVGLFSLIKLRKINELNERKVFFFSMVFISLILPLIFIQKGNPWNTIQFFYYFQFFLALASGVAMGKIKLGRTTRIFVYSIVIFLSLPTTMMTLKNNYLPLRPPSRVSVEELEALKFLGQQPFGVVLAYPFNTEWRKIFSEPKPLYAYETTAYIPALSGQTEFLGDEMNLEISGYNWQGRREDSIRFFESNNPSWANDFLKNNQIKYLYLVKGQKVNLNLEEINLKKIFENGEARIYSVN